MWDQEMLDDESSEYRKPALSDDTRIRGVTWGDFKDEAMEPDFDPSYFFVSTTYTQCLALTNQIIHNIQANFRLSVQYEVTVEERDLLNRLIAAQHAQGDMEELDEI